MTYEYIGDSTGIPHHYQLNVTLYRTTYWTLYSGVTGPSVCVNSSCFPSQNIHLNIKPGTPINGDTVFATSKCTNDTSEGFINSYRHELVGTVILAGPCSDYRFTYAFLCCRINNVNINNISSFPGSTNFLEAKLNNVFGNNSSARFINNQGTFNFCVDQNIVINHSALDVNGDSLHYELIGARAGNRCDTALFAIYDSPYTALQPFAADANGTSLDPNTGIISLKSSNITGNFIYVVRVEDYRWISGPNQYVRVGSVVLEGMISILDQCDPKIVNGSELLTNDSTKGNFPVSIFDRLPSLGATNIPNFEPVGQSQVALHVVEYNCLSTFVDLFFDDPMLCNSISSNGNEFRIYAPDSTLVPVIGIDRNCGQSITTQHITLELLSPLGQNGDFLVLIAEGLSGNTILNECGFSIPTNYAFVIQSEDCPIFSVYDYDQKHVNMVIYPNPNIGTFSVVGTGEPHVLRVYNMLGVCVIEERGHGEHLVSQAGLAQGNYVVRLEYPLNGRVEQQKMTVANRK